MKNFRNGIVYLTALFTIASCSTQNEFEGDFNRASTGIYFGTEAEMYSKVQESDSTFIEVSYNLKGVSETISVFEKTLNIDVDYAGGEGGCPSTKFFLQWDESYENVTDSSKTVSLGLAGFLVNSNVTCEALVSETLEFDMNTLFGTELSEITQINVENLYNNTLDSLVRGE
ncbi:MAG: hypothetical protein ROO71_12000 [Balneola sp.]